MSYIQIFTFGFVFKKEVNCFHKCRYSVCTDKINSGSLKRERASDFPCKLVVSLAHFIVPITSIDHLNMIRRNDLGLNMISSSYGILSARILVEGKQHLE